jgi:hypothetical protein
MKRKLKLEAVRDELLALNNLYDIEAAHCRADELLCEVLRMYKCDEIVEAFEQVEKWYA